MADLPRLNGVVKQLEAGKPVFLPFIQPTVEAAVSIATSQYDGCVFEMEHGIYDIRALRDALQYMLNRQQLVESGTVAPAVTPFVRIPPNGIEKVSWVAKQVLDIGIYGLIWPHCSTVEEAINAVSACRYPRREEAPLYFPPGIRGDAPGNAARYWGITNQEYYKRADVWPLAPNGEVMVVLMCEELRAIKNLPKMLEEVPGIGAILIGEGDLSQALGHPRQYEHPAVLSAVGEILRICKERGVACGHPHMTTKNVEALLQQGFRWLMSGPSRSYPGLDAGLRLAGRA